MFKRDMICRIPTLIPNLPKAGRVELLRIQTGPGKAGACIVLALSAIAAIPKEARAQGTPPLELVRTAIENELKDNDQTHLYSWKERKRRTPRGTQVEHLVKTPSGVVSRVVLIDEKPLTAEQQATEEERLRKATDPATMRRKLKEDQDDDARTRKLVAAIPEAFDFTYVDTLTAQNGHALTTLKFTPRAGYVPPTRELKVFAGMEGELVVDETAGRLAKVDGTLVKDVEFGWGIFGRLYKGGRFLIEKREVTSTHWDTARQLLHFDGKVFMFKSIHINEDETAWDYQPVPPMSVEQALDFLNHSERPQDATLAPERSRGARSNARSAPGAVHSRAPATRLPQSFRSGRP